MLDLHPYDEFRRGIIRERADKSGYGVEEFWRTNPAWKPARLLQIPEARSIKESFSRPRRSQNDFFRSPGVVPRFCVSVIGVDRTDPPLPRAASNHFRAARAAVETVFRLGYRRPGLCVSDKVDRILDRRWSAGFSAGVHDAPADADGRSTPLFFEHADRALFAKW